jgi:capsular polysaccharide biosynthesis protein
MSAMSEHPLTSTGDQLSRAIRRSLWILIVCCVAGAAAGVAWARRATPEYQGSATVLLSQVDISSVVPGAATTSTDPQRAVDTAVQLGQSNSFAVQVEQLVATRLGRPGEDLPGSFDVESSAGTDELVITAKAHSAANAELIANTAASAFPAFRGQQLAAPLVRASTAVGAGGDAATLKRIQTLKDLLQSSASVVDRATFADAVTPTPLKYGVIGFVTGLVVGLLLMALREALGGRVDGPEDIEQALHARVLGSLPRRQRAFARKARAANGAGTPLQRLAVLLDMQRPEGGGAVVSFIGTDPKIRVGWIAAATAEELERRGDRTQVVNFASAFEEVPADGAGDGEGDVDGDGGAEAPHERQPALAATAVRERDAADWVVIEGPSYLESPDAYELAGVVDAAVLVTRANPSQRGLRRISRELDSWPRKPFLTVLTVK